MPIENKLSIKSVSQILNNNLNYKRDIKQNEYNNFAPKIIKSK